jgi:uncharacterized protein
VLDLGGFAFKEEPLVVARSVLDDRWLRCGERRPFLVIDEAHNLRSPDVETAQEKAVSNRIIRIAAEGRKYGHPRLVDGPTRSDQVRPGSSGGED